VGSSLTIVGLGPGNPRQRTLEAVEALHDAERIILRTAIHPGLADLVADPRVSTCDDLYASSGSFDAVYDAIVERLLDVAQQADTVFAVPGHPLVGERTVTSLLVTAPPRGIPVSVIAGISAIDVMATSLGVDPMASEVQLIDAAELERLADMEPFSGSLADLSPLRPVLLAQVYSRTVASAAKLQLARIYPDDWPISVVSAAGVPELECIEHIPLYELDRITVDHLTSVWIPAMPILEAAKWPLTLARIAARLRAPDGCPWDRKQTHASLRASVIEEAYEVAEAIDDADPEHLVEELGDQLLLVSMHAQIGEENGEFSIGDVYEAVNRKLVRRHPHVFGPVKADTPDAVIQTWNDVKASERGQRGTTPTAEDPYDQLPKSMPVLTRIVKVSASESSNIDQLAADAFGNTLLELIRTMASAGLDPELELERAYRRQSAVVI
jgi:tetrapyrrole methylase family protein/MazG family protein